MFGVQYAVSNIIGAAAALLIIAGIARKDFQLDEYITIERYHDLAKITFAVCALWTYLVFSQILVIWYGDLPEETPYVIMRMQSLEWGWMFWVLFFLMFLIPFFRTDEPHGLQFDLVFATDCSRGPGRGLAGKIFSDCTVNPGE